MDLPRNSDVKMEKKRVVTGKSAKDANQDANMVEKNANVQPAFIYGRTVFTTQPTSKMTKRNLKRRQGPHSSLKMEKFRILKKKF